MLFNLCLLLFACLQRGLWLCAGRLRGSEINPGNNAMSDLTKQCLRDMASALAGILFYRLINWILGF